MASFYAELQVAGNSYRVVHCSYACHQATDARGRVQAKVRYAPLELVLDVPTDDGLLAWAHTPHKPLAGQVVFYDAARQTAHETIAFAAGECVQYAEDFASSATGDGAYVCQLTITAPSFELRAGGPVGAVSAVGAGVSAPFKAMADLPLGGSAPEPTEAGADAPNTGAVAAAVLAPLALVRAVNPSKGTKNCSHITEALIARLHGTDPLAVAPDENTRTLGEIEALYDTTFESIPDFYTAFNTINDSPEGTIALVAMGPREVTENSMGHIVTLVNHEGKAKILEAQDWGGYDRPEVITSPSRAIRRYGDAEETELAITFIPAPRQAKLPTS
jgi:hypothetical protein